MVLSVSKQKIGVEKEELLLFMIVEEKNFVLENRERRQWLREDGGYKVMKVRRERELGFKCFDIM